MSTFSLQTFQNSPLIQQIFIKSLLCAEHNWKQKFNSFHFVYYWIYIFIPKEFKESKTYIGQLKDFAPKI